jgi:hypothetical protein
MSQPIPTKSDKTPSWYESGAKIFSGGTGGAAGIFSATPLIYVKTILQEKARNPQTSLKWDKNPFKWFAGGSGLAAWMFPQAATAFYITDLMRKKLSNNGQKELTPQEQVACSAMAGGLLTLFVNPQELIFTQQKIAEGARLKMIEEQKLDPKSVPSKSALDVTKDIWKKHGLKGFCRGAPETAAREMVSNSILTYFAAQYPLLAPIFGAAISQPVDGRKTNKQADFAYKAQMTEMLKTKAFSGLIARIGIYLVFMNVAPSVKNQCEKLTLSHK